MNSGRQKMSNRTFRAIVLPIVAFLCALAVTALVVTDMFSVSLDTFLGRGERYVTTPEGTEGWDKNYYGQKFSEAKKSQAAAAEVQEKVTDEGIILLKNDGVLPLAKDSTVSPFGYRYIKPIYGGLGSSGSLTEKESVDPATALSEYFKINGAPVEKMKASKEEKIKEKPGTSSVTEGSGIGGFKFSTLEIKEYNPSIYEETDTDSYKGTTGLVFIGREGCEGGDEKKDAYEDDTPHQLALSENEKGTIRFAKKYCDSVVVILNVSNAMELGVLTDGEYEADAILSVGFTGMKGFRSMTKILCGEVNPSGKTVDIYPADFTKDPTYVNFGAFEYTNSTWIGSDSHKEEGRDFVEYEEGIYIGYRYYETAYAENAIDYDEAVIFPFGYGLSYSEFTQKITAFDDSGDVISVTVTVTNESDTEGKDVVQIYYSPEYTEYDKQNGIEKSAVVLAAFDKVNVPANGTAETTLTFPKEDMASYSYKHDNADGTKGCYILEEGVYTISLRTDSHNVVESRTYKQTDTIIYDNDNPRRSETEAQSATDSEGNPLGYPAAKESDPNAEFMAATNRFTSCNDYMNAGKPTNLSRSDWKNTFPTAPKGNDFTASQAVLDEVKDFDYKTDPELGNVKGSKVYAETAPEDRKQNGMTLADMRGKSYYDKNWEYLLDQIDYNSEQINPMLFKGAYNTGALDSVGKQPTNDYDGPAGLTQFFGGQEWCAWNSEVVLAATWNTELAYEMGEAVAQEALTTGVSGWYAPGLNTHRSPFGGRNFEYYSEDALLAGKIAAGVVSGAADNGLYCYLKHFALNEQETNRQNVCTWANEQAIREIYLRPFEICVKEAKCQIKYISDAQGTVSLKTMKATTAIMTAMNYIGGTHGFSHYGMITGVLRGEWGFNGIVETDMYNSTESWQRDKMLRAGGDIWMYSNSDYVKAEDMTSPTAKSCIRNAVHNICYTVVNSNAAQGAAPGSIVSYGTSPWKIGVVAGSSALFVLCAAGVVWVILRGLHEKKYPELYKSARR